MDFYSFMAGLHAAFALVNFAGGDAHKAALSVFVIFGCLFMSWYVKTESEKEG